MCPVIHVLPHLSNITKLQPILHLFYSMPLLLTGCQNTPSKGSRYCCDHEKTALVFCDDSKAKEGSKDINDTNTPGSLIVSLLNEHTTRQGVIYEVKNILSA